jgi:hypothetical protein
MRYLLIGVMIAVAMIGTLALANMPGQGDMPGSQVAVLPTALATPRLPGLPDIELIATFAPSEPIPTLPVPLTRAQAIQIARSDAASMGEEDAVLIDVMYTTVEDANARISGTDEVPEYEGSTKLAWLVRMRGSFRPAGYETGPRESGWMFVVVEADTGLRVRRGYRPESIPTEP